MRTRVKMCGTTRLEDAQAAVRYGVDALGFILFAKSQRYISVANARLICQQLPPFIDRVGVLVNEDIKEAVRIVQMTGFSYLQLHGDESRDYCLELKKILPHLKLIKAFRLSGQSTAEEFKPYEDCVDGFLLDTYVKGAKGGTGEVFDWSVIAGLNLSLPVILAGGLTAGNIARAVATVRPFGVDINSGVENHPGEKNHNKLKEIMLQIAA